jgi:4-hydroxymandelate oxidase
LGSIEQKWAGSVSRRKALAGLAGIVAGSPLLQAQLDPRPFSEHRRTPGLAEMFSPFDFEPIMFSNVRRIDYDYTAHGDGGEWNLRRNRQAFEWVDLVPGTPAAPASVDLSTRILNLTLKYPVMIAPSALQTALHPEGEAGMYRAATLSSGTPLCLSNVASQSVEEVAKAAQGQLWWQFYPQQSLDVSRQLIERAQAAGYTAIVVTVDQQASYYERSQRSRNLGGRSGRAAIQGVSSLVPAAGPAAPQQPKGALRYRVPTRRLWYTWQYLDDIRQFVKGPMIIKGIVTAEDAKLCVERGMDAIVVSNHGGRSMDYGPSTLEVLPEIVAAVNGKIPVMIDSGFRRGADILKALALGADAVWLGRSTRWALGAFGPAGVEKLLTEMIFKELVEATAAAGRTTLASIDSSIVRTNWT